MTFRCLSGGLTFLGFLLSALVPGMGEEPAQTPQDQTPTVTLKVKSWEGVQKMVAARKGKVVVVNIWTTTCGKCVEEFPEFAALQQEFPREKVTLISVNCDYDGIKDKPPEFYREKVLAFLRKQKATFPNVMLNVAFIDFLEQIDLSSSPAFYVYGADGKLAKRFDNDDVEKVADEFTMEEVTAKIAELVRAAKTE